jgi:hypothetical protein
MMRCRDFTRDPYVPGMVLQTGTPVGAKTGMSKLVIP